MGRDPSANDGGMLLPDLLLGRYRVEGMLGEGGLGTVVKAYDTRLKRIVAIKTLRRSTWATDPELFRHMEERFTREAEAGARIGFHPNVVSVLDLVTDTDKTRFLIQEFVPGGTLAVRIGRRSLTSVDALRFTADIARGLHAAHEKGIIHRDLKPANIFLAEDDRAKVGDFGVAQLDDLSHRTRAMTGHPGTPLYMSPEQERHTQYLRPASDQFSLGLILFEMISGTIYRRVGDRTAATLLDDQLERIATLVRRMLNEHPDDRYPSMTVVVEVASQAERELAGQATIPSVPSGHLSQHQTPLVTRKSIPADTGSVDAPTEFETTSTEITKRPSTPKLNLGPVPPVIPPLNLPVRRRVSRRALIAGIGGIVLAGGTTGGILALTSSTATNVSTPPSPNLATMSTTTSPLGPSAATDPAISVAATRRDASGAVETVLPVRDKQGKVVPPLVVLGEYVIVSGQNFSPNQPMQAFLVVQNRAYPLIFQDLTTPINAQQRIPTTDATGGFQNLAFRLPAVGEVTGATGEILIGAGRFTARVPVGLS